MVSDGKRMTMAFVPHKDGENPPMCMDVEYEGPHKLPEEFGNSGMDYYAHRLVGFSGGGNAFRTEHDDKLPTTLFTLLLGDNNAEG